MLFGEGSLNPGHVLNKCVGKIWGVKKITYLSVALAGILVSPPPTLSQPFSSVVLHST